MATHKVITVMSATGTLLGDFALSNKVTESHTSTREHISDLIDIAKKYGDDDDPKVSWSTFLNRRGHTIEKCAIEWTQDGVRMTDVVWINKGYSYF